MMEWEKQNPQDTHYHLDATADPNNRVVMYVKVMTDEQLETLTKQTAFYATICEQLVEMHKNLTAQQDLVGIFCLPAGKSLPLHDHPGLTVLSKLLYGSVHAKSYDWLTKKSSSPTSGVSAVVINDVLNAPCEPLVLFPRSGRNIHSFSAVTPCAILDVIHPPYSEKAGRPCTYFTASPIPTISDYAMLEERDAPTDLVAIRVPYLGPSLKIGKTFPC